MLLVISVLALLPASLASAREPAVPVNVYYPATSCRGGEIELEVWNRSWSSWLPHPGHARIPAGSCQLEEHRLLWDEVRYRCADPLRETEWIVGADRRCGVAAEASVFGDLRIEFTSPAPGVPVRAAEPAATVVGEVLLGGRRGVLHDVVIVLDVSQAGGRERIDLQVEAALRFLEEARPRLGDVRIGVVTFPQLDSASGVRAFGRREIALSSDAPAIERALRRVSARGPTRVSDSRDLPEALAFGMAETQHLQLGPREGSRLYSRKVLLISTDSAWTQSSQPGSRVVDLARRARERGIAIHLFAFGESYGPRPAWVEAMLRYARGSFSRPEAGPRPTAFLLDQLLPDVSDVRVRNATIGLASQEVRFDADGSFAARIPATFGENEVVVEASSSRGETALARYIFEFDGSLVRARLLAIERSRIERMRRRRRLWIEPADPTPLR